MGLLEVTTKIDNDGTQDEETLTGLESPLDGLSIAETTTKDINDVESAFAKVSLKDDVEVKQTQEKEGVAESKDQAPDPETSVAVCPEEVVSVKEDHVKEQVLEKEETLVKYLEKEETLVKVETLVKEETLVKDLPGKEEVLVKEEVLEKEENLAKEDLINEGDPATSSSKKTEEEEEDEVSQREEEDSQLKEETGEVDSETKEKEDEKNESADEKEPEGDADDKKGKDESGSETESKAQQDKDVTTPKKRYLSRPEFQNQNDPYLNGLPYQNYSQPWYYDETQVFVTPAINAQHTMSSQYDMSTQQTMNPACWGMPVSPGLGHYMDSYSMSPMPTITPAMNGPHTMSPQYPTSPQQATTPTYLGPSGLPVPSYTDPLSPSPVSDGFYADGQSPMDGSTSIGMSPCWAPETPPSLLDDFDNYQLYSEVPEQTDHASQGSVQSHMVNVMEAIDIVEDSSYHSKSAEPGRLEEIERDLYSEINRPKSTGPSPLTDGTYGYQHGEIQILSPPCEIVDITGNIHEQKIRNLINEEEEVISRRKIGAKLNERLTEKDSDGDNPFMVSAARPETSLRYYANLCVLVDRAKELNICCERLVDKQTGKCLECGNTNQRSFYSPLSMCNNQGDTILSIMIKTQKSLLTVNYICESIFKRQSDRVRIFGKKYADIKHITGQSDMFLANY